MMKKITIKTPYRLFLFILLGFIIIYYPSTSRAYTNTSHRTVAPDSVGTEVSNGYRFVIHKVAPQETYYQLGRIYNVPVKDIMQANSKKNLRVGDTVKIPRGKTTVAAEPSQRNTEINAQPQTPPATNAPQNVFTEYKVGKNETLYAISRRFSVSVDDIKKMNNMTSNTLREGQIIKIPDTGTPAQTVPEVVPTPIPEIVEERQPIDDSDFRGNKYGIREKKERGIGTWMDMGDGQTSLALHKTAPVGTILKITNPMNKSVTFAKVVGKFGDNQDTQDAIVVLSKSVATSLGLLDKRFLIELNYGVPLE